MGSTTTSKTEIPPPTEQEKQLLQMVTENLLPAYLDQQGWDVKTVQVPFEESEQGKKLSSAISAAQAKKDEIARTSGYASGQFSGLNIGAADRDVREAQAAYDKAKSEYIPVTKYDMNKRESAYVEAVKKKYGVDSQEYTAAKSKEAQDTIDREGGLAEIQKTYIEKTKKFLNGDFSISDQQKAYIKDMYAPISAAVDKMTSDNIEQTTKTFDAFRKEVANTSMSVSAALDVVGSEIQKTGADMKEALGKTIEVNKALMKMGIEDYSGQITKKTNTLAANLGRSPSDPEFQKELQDSVAREVQRGTLNLADMQARGELSISERTGAGMEGVAKAKAGLAETQGNKLEGAAMNEGQQKGQILAQAGQMRTDLEREKANTAYTFGAGMPPQQIAIGQGSTQFNEAMIAQRLQNAAGAMGQTTGVYNTFARDRFAQPTTTTERPWGVQDYLGTALGVANLGIGAYTGIAQAGAMRSFAGAPATGATNTYGGGYNLGYGGNYGF